MIRAAVYTLMTFGWDREALASLEPMGITSPEAKAGLCSAVHRMVAERS